MNLSRACPAFSVAFMVVYLASMYLHPNLTLFTYAPRADVWHMGIPDLGRGGPGMYWFSWLSTAFAAGLGAGGRRGRCVRCGGGGGVAEEFHHFKDKERDGAEGEEQQALGERYRGSLKEAA